MSRSRVSLVLILLLVVGALVFALAANSGDSPVEELEKQVLELSKRVQALETQVKAIRTSGAGGANQALENEAMQAFRQINTLVTSGKTEEAKTQLAAFNNKYRSTKVARQAQRMAQELSVVGKSSPSDWGIEKWYQGENDIVLDGNKPTLVVFWETWCPHCRREVPKLQAIYDNYKDQGLQVIGLTKVNKSATDETVNSFIAEQKLGYPVAKENGQTSQYFSVSGVPAAAVVKDGKVVWRGHPVRLTDDMLKGWL